MLLNKINNDSSIRGAVIISGKPGSFIAGADLNMLTNFKTAEEASQISKRGQEILFNFEKCSKPIVAAIKGSCLGGGMEVSFTNILLISSHSFTNRKVNYKPVFNFQCSVNYCNLEI